MVYKENVHQSTACKVTINNLKAAHNSHKIGKICEKSL